MQFVDEDAAVERIVERAAAGDGQAWNALVDAYGGLVWAVARREVRSARDAADVSQTAWLRLVEHIDRLSEPARVGAWLATTTRREGRRVAAKAHRVVPTDDARLQSCLDGEEVWRAASNEGLDAEVVRQEAGQTLTRAISRLAEREQVLLRLLMHEPALSYATISGTMGMPIGSIGPTRARCLAKLRILLAGQT